MSEDERWCETCLMLLLIILLILLFGGGSGYYGYRSGYYGGGGMSLILSLFSPCREATLGLRAAFYLAACLICRKHARISCTNIFGCSNAAKWPPLSSSLK